MCSSPSSSRITVPEAALLPSVLRPMRRSYSAMTSAGKPFGYVRNGSSTMRPIISQWPVVVSLPAVSSAIRPNAPRGDSVDAGCGSVCSNPMRARLGRVGCCESRTWPRGFEPSSPKSRASGSSPTPRESQTMTMARLFIERRLWRVWTPARSLAAECHRAGAVGFDLAAVNLVEERDRRGEDVVDSDLVHAAVVHERAVALVAGLAGERFAHHARGARDDGAIGIGRPENRDRGDGERRGEMQRTAVVRHDNGAVRDGGGEMQHISVVADDRQPFGSRGNG